jgi:tRNA pseudouridine55 synthase
MSCPILKKSAKPRTPDNASGLLLLDKPAGVTSYDCVHLVKRKLQVDRVGHCGTLDPRAKGLMLILVGKATRTQESFLGLEKQYWFRAEFGRQTSTGDAEGEVVAERPWQHLDRPSVESGLREWVGTRSQIPPRYSALKYQGKPYYAYARRGIEIPRAPRTIEIRLFELLSLELPFWEARLICSRGTYVRALVEDVGERLGTCATLLELVRERVGFYTVENALSWMDLRDMSRENLLHHLQTLPSPLVGEGVRMGGTPHLSPPPQGGRST